MAKKEKPEEVGTWIIRTDGSKENEAPIEAGKPAFLSINGKRHEIKTNEPFTPTAAELDALEASHYNLNGHLMRYDDKAIDEKNRDRQDAEEAAREGRGENTVQAKDLPAPEENSVTGKTVQSALKQGAAQD